MIMFKEQRDALLCCSETEEGGIRVIAVCEDYRHAENTPYIGANWVVTKNETHNEVAAMMLRDHIAAAWLTLQNLAVLHCLLKDCKSLTINDSKKENT